MTSSTDRYIAGYVDDDGDIALCGHWGVIRRVGLGAGLRCAVESDPRSPWQMYKLVPVDASGNPLPTPEVGPGGESPSTGQPGGSNGPSGIDAETPGRTLTASRDESGRIAIGVKPTRIVIAAGVPPAEIQKWRSEASSPYLRAAYGAALALLDREEADAKAKAEVTEPEPLTVRRDEHGQIRVNGKIVAYSSETCNALIRERAGYKPTDKWWHMLTAAIDFIDREDSEKAEAANETREIVVNGGVWTLGKRSPAPEPGVWVAAFKDYGRWNVETVHPTEIDALRAVNGSTHLRAIHLPYGTTLEEATKNA